MLLSGIGPQAELQRHGIAVAHALPGVGQNLQDHIDYVQTWHVPSHTETFGASLRGAAKVAAAMQARPDGTLQDWVALAYADTDPRLWPIALRSLQAHVDRLNALRRAA